MELRFGASNENSDADHFKCSRRQQVTHHCSVWKLPLAKSSANFRP